MEPSESLWWKSEKNPAEIITGVMQQMAQNSLERLRDYRIGARLYGATDLWGPYTRGTSTSVAIPTADGGRLRLNVTQACTDTLNSKIAKNKPRPMFLTSGGDYQKQREAQKLTAFMDGVFSENRAYDLGPEAFRDGCVMGDGFVHVRMDGDRVVYERTPAWELFVDDNSAISAYPRQLHRVQLLDREVLVARFPKKKKEIEASNGDTMVFPVIGGSTISDLVELHESWRLPSTAKSKDGRYVASIGAVTLESKPWNRQRFPFARFRWCTRTGGFWSQGLAEQLKPVQLDINREAALLQKAHYRQTTFDVMVPTQSKVVTDKFSNETGNIVKYSGMQAPYSVSPSIAQPERYRYLWTLYDKAFEISGVSQMAAAGVVPAGLESGKAMRTFSAIGTDRFARAVQEYDRFFLELAEITIDTVAEYVDEGKTNRYPVRAPSWSGFDEIDFKEIELAREDYSLTVFPTASLPNEPAGRVQDIQDMENRGIITPQTALRLYDFPDVQAESALITAPETYAAKVFSDMLDDEFTAPEPYDDLKLMRKMALQHYCLWRQQGVAESSLNLLRRFMEELTALEKRAMPPAPPPSTTPMPVPGMPSMAAPPMMPDPAAMPMQVPAV